MMQEAHMMRMKKILRSMIDLNDHFLLRTNAVN